MNAKNNRDPAIFYGWWIVAASFILLFLYAGAGFYSFSIFIEPLETHFGWSRSAISFAMSIYLMGHGLVAPVIGRLIETHGPKKILTFCVIGSGASFIIVSFTNSIRFFYFAYALLSITTTGIGYVPVSCVLARWFIKKRGLAIGISMMGISLGGLTMAPIVNYLNETFTWRYSFICMGFMVWILALPLTLFIIKGSPREKGLLPDNDPCSDTPQDTLPENQGWPLSAALRSRPFPWIALTFLLAPLAQMGVLQHQVPLITRIGISSSAAATALGLTAGLGGLGKLSFGWISQKIPFHYAAMICFGLQALGLFILLNADSLAMVWIYVFLFGFAMGGVVVLMPLVVGHFFGLAAFGTIMGILSLIQAVGYAGGAFASGYIYDYFGSYHYAIICYVGIYFMATLTIFLAGKPRVYQPENM